MNEGVVTRSTAWSLVASGVGALLWVATTSPVTVPGIGALRLNTPPHAPALPYPVDSLARLAVARPLFRASRRSSSVAYDPQRAVAPVESNQPPKPLLALVGIVAGQEPTAVIEGFPGVEGSRVVRAGDIVSALRVKRVEADRVVIVGMDTTWVLKVREPWKP